MSATKPPGYDDRFVATPEPSRRGAHRARVSPLLGALPVVAVAAVVVVVIVLAWTVLSNQTDSSSDRADTGPKATAPARPSTQPATGGPGTASPSGSATFTPPDDGVDRTVDVRVLNSTTRDKLAAKVAGTLVGKGWMKATASGVRYQGRPTTVYYATSDQKPAAEALVEDLGVGRVRQNSSIAATGITVIVGTDYP